MVEKGREKGRVLKVGLICGGPSAERGISLNSARSVLDHLQAHIFLLEFNLFKFNIPVLVSLCLEWLVSVVLCVKCVVFVVGPM